MRGREFHSDYPRRVSLQVRLHDVICSTEYGNVADESFPQQTVCCAVTAVICLLWAKGTLSISQHFVCEKVINLKCGAANFLKVSCKEIT